MCLRSRATVLALLGVALFAPSARAQPQYGPTYGPGFNPGIGSGFNPNFIPQSSYLNLAQGQGRGFNPGIAFNGILKPQSQFNGAIQGLQRQNGPFNPFTATEVNPDSPVLTGHVFGFQNHQNYFQNQFALGSYGGTGTGTASHRAGTGSTNSNSGVNNLNPGAVAPPRSR